MYTTKSFLGRLNVTNFHAGKDMWTSQKKNPLGYRKKEAMNGDGE